MNNAPLESSFFRWVRGLGVWRSENRWIGGVAGGLGRRFGIDPVLARGIVLVLVVFTGIGLLLYGLAWALLPEPDGRIHAQEAGRGRWRTGMTGALAFFVLGTLGSPGPFGGWDGDGDWNGWWGGTLWTLVLVGAVVWFAATRGSRRDDAVPPPEVFGPAEEPRTTTPQPPTATGPLHASPSTYASPTTYGPVPTTYGPSTGYAPASAPAPGAAPPAPSTREATRNPLPGSVVAIVLGIAVLVGGTTSLASILGWFDLGAGTPAVALAAALTVLGFGLVGASLRRHSGGALTGFAIALLVPTLLAGGATVHLPANAPAFGPAFGPAQSRDGNEYTYVFSAAELDLRPLGRDLEADTAVTVNNVFSSLDLTVPDDIPVVIHGDSAFYALEVSANGETSHYAGIGGDDGGIRLNPDATGPTLSITIDGAFHSVNATTQEVSP